MEKEPENVNDSWLTGKKLSESAEKTLEDLRHGIDNIDRQIVDLLAQRQSVVQKVVSLKRDCNLPVHHPAREENLISDRRSRGKKAGLNPDYLEELFRCILRQSRVEQTSSISKKGLRPGAGVLIVGGTRGMGEYFYQLFQKAGYETRRMGSRDWPKIEQLCEGISLAVISVPIDLTVNVIQQIAPYLPEGCILTDLTSIKGPPMKAMLKHYMGPVVGLHPMFGPTTSSMDKQIVVATPGRQAENCQWLIDQFVAWGAVLVHSDASEHDEIMAIVQALRHFAAFTFGQFLYSRKLDISRTLDFSSPIYRLEMGMVGRLFAQDPALYCEIIFASPERRNILKDYISCLSDNLAMIEKGDKEMFINQFEVIADWFGPFGDQALRESSYLIDKLIERF